MENKNLNLVLKSLPETYSGQSNETVFNALVSTENIEAKESLVAQGYAQHEYCNATGVREDQAIKISNGITYVITEAGKAFLAEGGFKEEKAFSEAGTVKEKVEKAVKKK